MPTTTFPDRPVKNLGSFLPGLISLDGKPMRMTDHYPLLPFLSTDLPRFITARAARQVGKTSVETAGLAIRSSNPGHKALVVLPLLEQSDRLSSLVFRPMLEDSPINALLRDADSGRTGTDNVRRRAFSNRSVIQFGHAGDNPNRLRSIAAREIDLDEAQDINPQHMSVIRECQSSFPTGRLTLTYGTSKTLDTLLEKHWRESSQGIWHVRCTACGYDNRTIVEDGDAIGMIGPIRDDISEKRPGTLCVGCRVPVNPRYGRWVHRYPERLKPGNKQHVGYNLPQIIFPFHFAYRDTWADIVNKMTGRAIGYSTARFHNEVMAAAYELSVRLLARSEIEHACQPDHPNEIEHALRRAQRYELIVMGVDWGGGGESGTSQTRLAIAAWSSDGGIDLLYGATMPHGMDVNSEAEEIFRTACRFQVSYIAHDYNGAGMAREATLTHMEWPLERIVPVIYHETPGAKLFRFVSAEGARYRGFYHQSKALTLQFLATAVKVGRVRFYRYDFNGDDDPGLLNDFNNYVENRFSSPNGKSIYQVRAVDEDAVTDFADALNFAASFIWELTNSWPSLRRTDAPAA